MANKELGPEDFPVITVQKGMGGWFAVMMCWNSDEGGFFEPEETGVGRYATWKEATEEAREWAAVERVRLDLGTCTDRDMHEKYADRGIEDQCPHCLVSADLGRVGDAL